MPLSPRFLRRVSNRERVVVGLEADGTPSSVRVQQTLVLNRLGDFTFAIAAPVISVLPGPGTQSQPGQRTNQILWQGFSPGTRVLAALADLRVDASAPSLPVKVRFEPAGAGTAVIVENVTGVTAKSYTADVEPVSLAQVVGRVRNAMRRNLFAEGLNIEVSGDERPVEVRVAAPLRVSGMVRSEGASRSFSALLDGIRRRELRVVVPGHAPPKISMRVRTADVPDGVRPTQETRAQLAEAIKLELTYARKRQYDQFITSPDSTGHSSTTYVYRTAPRPATIIPSSSGDSGGGTTGWIALAVVLIAALPVALVIWARS
jgi:hypothetical protein